MGVTALVDCLHVIRLILILIIFELGASFIFINSTNNTNSTNATTEKPFVCLPPPPGGEFQIDYLSPNGTWLLNQTIKTVDFMKDEDGKLLQGPWPPAHRGGISEIQCGYYRGPPVVNKLHHAGTIAAEVWGCICLYDAHNFCELYL